MLAVTAEMSSNVAPNLKNDQKTDVNALQIE